MQTKPCTVVTVRHVLCFILRFADYFVSSSIAPVALQVQHPRGQPGNELLNARLFPEDSEPSYASLFKSSSLKSAALIDSYRCQGAKAMIRSSASPPWAASRQNFFSLG
jgi:hypothetical protein